MRILAECLAAMVIVATFISPSVAAEITLKKNANTQTAVLLLEGPIVAGDSKKLLSLTEDAANEQRTINAIKLRSPGGDVIEALKISEILNEFLIAADAPTRPIEGRNLKTEQFFSLPDDCKELRLQDTANCVCNSACAIIWLSSTFRSGDYIGIHRPRFNENYFSNLSVNEAENKYKQLSELVVSFLTRNEVPTELITEMMSTPSSQIHFLTEDEIELVGEGRSYALELLDAKCIQFHAERDIIQALKERYELLSRQLDKLTSVGDFSDETVKLSDDMLGAQTAYYSYEKSSKYPKCISEITREMRTNAQIKD